VRRRRAGSIVVIDCAVIVLNCRGNATALINEPPIITKRSSFLQRCNYNALPLHPQSHCFLLRHRHAHSPQPCRFGSGLPLLTAAPPLRAARARATVVWWVVHLRASQRVAVQAALARGVVAQLAAHWHAARWRTALPSGQRTRTQCGGMLRSALRKRVTAVRCSGVAGARSSGSSRCSRSRPLLCYLHWGARSIAAAAPTARSAASCAAPSARGIGVGIVGVGASRREAALRADAVANHEGVRTHRL